ncbi:hypothetical protein P171DRAFT_440753 [Karstenula rhodostoma CBS 690.94]|uniref:Uncharacterized protein n=1 Tax=Karstenula rhodostoma CBS 690.94 TaxID=1392251 RepID=A0A9P4PQH5_9PLEO|nr:hypothetical protein P171DRAFT_440753 [Karstenula rhodostoma CBS 690.94]
MAPGKCIRSPSKQIEVESDSATSRNNNGRCAITRVKASHWNEVQEETDLEWWRLYGPEASNEVSDTDSGWETDSDDELSEYDPDELSEYESESDEDQSENRIDEAREAQIRNFVESLEHIEHGSISPQDSRCPICRLPYGETDEFDDMYEPLALPEDPQEAETVSLFQEMPLGARRPNNDTVILPCRHVFG